MFPRAAHMDGLSLAVTVHAAFANTCRASARE